MSLLKATSRDPTHKWRDFSKRFSNLCSIPEKAAERDSHQLMEFQPAQILPSVGGVMEMSFLTLVSQLSHFLTCSSDLFLKDIQQWRFLRFTRQNASCSYLKTFYDAKSENPLLQIKTVFLVERHRVNEERALLPCAALAHYVSEYLSYFSSYSCRLKNSASFVLCPQVNAFHIQCFGFKLQLRQQVGNAVGRFFTKVLFKTVPRISSHRSKLGIFH